MTPDDLATLPVWAADELRRQAEEIAALRAALEGAPEPLHWDGMHSGDYEWRGTVYAYARLRGPISADAVVRSAQEYMTRWNLRRRFLALVILPGTLEVSDDAPLVNAAEVRICCRPR